MVKLRSESKELKAVHLTLRHKEEERIRLEKRLAKIKEDITALKYYIAAKLREEEGAIPKAL